MKKILTVLLTALLLCTLTLGALADGHPPRLVDNADLLMPEEEQTLLSELDEISQRQAFDVVVVTVNDLNGQSPMAYADDYYDYNGYGFGEDGDGALLLISMAERDWYISTKGYGIYAITDWGLDYIAQYVMPELSSGSYAEAFSVYARLCDDFVTEARTNEPYDIGNESKAPFSVGSHLLLALVVGFVIALIAVSVMKAKLKSVHQQNAAAQYVRSGSLNVTERRDVFLYRKVDRIKRPKQQTRSGGGSSVHVSSSGSSHGGGGGKF